MKSKRDTTSSVAGLAPIEEALRRKNVEPFYKIDGGLLYCGDCLAVMKGMPDRCVDLVVTDPPYNIGKAEWDRIENYEAWLNSVFMVVDRILKPCGALLFFHMRFDVLSRIHRRIEWETSLRHRQLIIIDKGIGSVAGRCNFESMRTFPRATEYLQLYDYENMTGAEELAEKYQACNPMAKYLKDEFKRAGVTQKKMAALFLSKTGGMTGCISNWLLGYNFPTKEQYLIMRDYLNGEYLRQEYEDLRQEYEDLRRPFSLPEATTDVLQVNFYSDVRVAHPTRKPHKLIKMLVESFSRTDGLIFDPFAGSGSTLVAAKQLGRQFIGIEIDPGYCEIARKRIALATEQQDLFRKPTTEKQLECAL